MKKPDLSIIIVNYQSALLIDQCLDSFLHLTDLQIEVWVIDNNSNDRALSRLLKKYPVVRFHQMSYNAGFARANNWGIQHSSADMVLLLNPDTVIVNDTIQGIYNEFRSSQYVAAGAQLLNEDKTPQISGNFFITGGINNLLPLPTIGAMLKWIGNRFNVKKTNLADSNELVEVDWINGAFIMVKKTAIDKAGFLDEDFFLYAEEIEWCSRLRKQGKLAIFGQYKVFHLQGESANQTFQSTGKGYYNLYDKKGLQILVSNFLRVRKQFGIVWYLFHLFFYTAELILLMIRQLFSKLLGDNSFPEKMVSGYSKNLIILYKLSPKMLLNKPNFYKML